MTNSPGTLFQSIPSNKLYPPRINRSQSIPRHAIIANHLPDILPSQTFVIVEAQAGQGKTTLVHQYLEYCRKPFIWYQVGSEDNDPVLLLSALQLALSRSFAGFSTGRLDIVPGNDPIDPLDLQRCANILLNAIHSTLVEDTFIVFDDLHLLAEAPLTRQLLDYLIDTAPPRLHFILTSRHPLQLGAKSLRSSPHLVYLDSENLALSPAEIEALYHCVLHTTISRTEAMEIFNITNGWIMGIILAAHPFTGNNGKWFRKEHGTMGSTLLSPVRNGYIFSYFEKEIFIHIPDSLRKALLQLSFLDDIDIALAKILSTVDDLEQQLGNMADRNFFVYRLDDENKMFRFHHLFQEFLQITGRKTLSGEAVAEIYRLAARYYLEHDLVEMALKTMCISGDFAAMEEVLHRHGPHIMSTNRTVTILSILKTIPQQTLLTHPWLTFYYGLLSMDSTPKQTLPFFSSCLARFAASGDAEGELLALALTIHFHIVISGEYRTGAGLLEKTRALFEQARDRLPAEVSIIVARNLAAGFCLFDGNMTVAHHYAHLGYELALTRDSKHLIAATRFILGYIGLLCGDSRMVRREIEKSYALAGDPLVGTSNRLSLHLMQLFELSMHGDFPAFFQHRDLVRKSLDQNVVRQTIAGPYLSLWSAIASIANGRLAEAHDQLGRGMQITSTATNGHLTSQFLQWRALVEALLGNEAAALADLDQSARLRTAAGGPFHTACHHAVKGASLTILSRYAEAEQALTIAQQVADSIPAAPITACCLAYQTLIDIARGNRPKAARHLTAWFAVLNRHGYSFFWGWEPNSMTRLLCTAVEMNIEAAGARRLARQRLGLSIDATGKAFPLLEISILGTFSLGSSGRAVFGPQDLSCHQRELFGLLVASPGQRLSQEQVQLSFWPDSPPDKARKSFDTLMTRLRKALSKKLSVPAKYYLNVEKGYVQLLHVSIDAIHFLRYANHGLKLAKQGLWWQAGNSFTKALSFWNAFRPIDSFASDQAVAFGDDMIDVMRRLCLTWSSKLIEINRAEEALDLLKKTERILPVDEDSVSLRYHLFLKKHQLLKANEVLLSYRQELRNLGCNDEEAEEMLTSLTAKSVRPHYVSQWTVDPAP